MEITTSIVTSANEEDYMYIDELLEEFAFWLIMLQCIIHAVQTLGKFMKNIHKYMWLIWLRYFVWELLIIAQTSTVFIVKGKCHKISS